MAVGLNAPTHLSAVAGIQLASTRAIKSRTRDDLSVMTLSPGSAVAGVFTQNRFAGPPVAVCREHLSAATAARPIRALAINAGIANAGTAGGGMRDARRSCTMLAGLLGCRAQQVLPFSTGVISVRLPMDKYERGLKKCIRQLADNNWLNVADAIRTTDTVSKGVSRTVGGITITGIAKGSGMIHPDMRTMLAFVATDAAVTQRQLSAWQKRIARDTFNAISVDGDTSTNDSFALIATGKSGKPKNQRERNALFAALLEVCAHLAEAIVRDGEGAKKLITLTVVGGKTRQLCRQTAAAVATSPLVKTAFAAGDANIGRLLMAIGNAPGNINPNTVSVRIGNVPTIAKGTTDPRYRERAAAAVLAGECVPVHIKLGGSPHRVVFKTCDLTHRYIEINADYRS